MAHYPPYCSKWNPIEHRLFPHLTGACRGVIFHTLETVRYYMAKAKTKKGLKVKVSILDKVYETGRKYAAGFKKTMKIVFDEFLPKWNYRAVPQSVWKSGSVSGPFLRSPRLGAAGSGQGVRSSQALTAAVRAARRSAGKHRRRRRGWARSVPVPPTRFPCVHCRPCRFPISVRITPFMTYKRNRPAHGSHEQE